MGDDGLTVAEIFVGIALRHVKDALSELRTEIAPQFRDEDNSRYGSSYQQAVGQLEGVQTLLADMQKAMRSEIAEENKRSEAHGA